MSVTVGRSSNGEPLTCEKLLGGSGWVRGRLIALALIRGSHRLSAARSCPCRSRSLTSGRSVRGHSAAARYVASGTRLLDALDREHQALLATTRAALGGDRFDAEHHHAAAQARPSPSARLPPPETRLRHRPGAAVRGNATAAIRPS